MNKAEDKTWMHNAPACSSHVVLRYLRTMILRRDLLSIANWHSLQHLPITSSRFPNHQDIRHIDATKLLLELSQKTTSTQYLVPLQSSSKLSQRSPIFFCKMRHCCSVLSPGHPTSSWIRRSTWNRGRWQGGTSGCGKLHKGTKKKEILH